MRIGILGSGLMGGKLGVLFARAGHEVVYSYARTRQKLEGLARDAGTNARAGTPRRERKRCCWPSTGPECMRCCPRRATWRARWSRPAPSR